MFNIRYNLFIIQLLTFIPLLFFSIFYFLVPKTIDKNLTLLSIGIFFYFLVIYFYSIFICRMSKYPFSLTLLFIISYFIVFLQLPVDFLLGSYEESYIFGVIYDYNLLNLNVLYATVFFGAVIFGIVHQLGVNIKNYSLNSMGTLERKLLPRQPFFAAFYLFFVLHLLTIEPSYYFGMHKEDPDGIAGSILGYFIRILPICFGVVIYNAKIQGEQYSFKKFLSLFPKLFLLILVLFSVGTFLAGDRGPAIRALILLVFSFFIISRKSISIFYFFILLFIAGYFLSIIKLIGAVDFRSTDLLHAFLDAFSRFQTSDKNSSIIPFTAELSASFRSYSTAFSLWYNGTSLYGISVLTGILMFIPFGVSTLMLVTGLNKQDINASFLITSYTQESYGLGNSIVGDALLNVGFIGALILAYFIGRLFIAFDFVFYKRTGSVFLYAVGCYFLMNSVILARGSFFPHLGSIFFIYLFVYIVLLVSSRIRLSK
ncbi:O-antigen polymerase [Alkanindiges illinoisensis]|uniref:O-antigen polymerase n=1 Tax=Alkanindiges illinoisensis TaxID=197183 RepID=UPI00047D8EEA|nr:O-antigen polymerase [Alkanindiges illinoisensis]